MALAPEKKDLAWCFRNDALYNAMATARLSEQEIIGRLVLERRQIEKDLNRTRQVAPFKVLMPDGGWRIWRCPDDLVPIRNLAQAMASQPRNDQG